MADWVTSIEGLSTCLGESAEVSAYLWEKGWAERNAGNLSVDVTDAVERSFTSLEPAGLAGAAGPLQRLDHAYPALGGRVFVVTGAGHRFRDLARDIPQHTCMLRMTPEGDAFTILWGGDRVGRERGPRAGGPPFRPTSEFPTHLRIHEHLRESKAPERVVLHTHPTELIAVSHIPEFEDEGVFNRALWSIHPEVKVSIPRGVGIVPYTVPGTETIAAATVDAIRRGHPVVVWQWHGCLAVAPDVLHAFDLIDTANKAAQILLACKAAGIVPRGLSDAQLDELVKAFGL